MTSAMSSGDARQPFPESGLDALLASAARDCPDTVLMSDDEGPSTAQTLVRRVGRLAALLRLAGLMPGERVLIVAGAQTGAFVALAAALRAGLEPALAPCGLGPIDMASYARTANAAALIGPSRYGSLDCGDIYLSAAAVADTIRLIATQGPTEVDGALDVSSRRLDLMSDLADLAPPDVMGEARTISTFEGPLHAPVLVIHRQASLFADALSLVEQARINPSKRIMSTLPPATLAGLVAGPFAALIGAAGLVLHGPFDGSRFLAACDREPGCHLIAPVAIGPLFRDDRLADAIGSLVLVSRFPDAAAFGLPESIAAARPIIDLYAYGERSLLAQRRADGAARLPDRVPDKSLAGGLGTRLNRARAEARLQNDGS